MSVDQLRERVCSLSARFPGLAIGADIYALSIIELWGLYRFLQRLADG